MTYRGIIAAIITFSSSSFNCISYRTITKTYLSVFIKVHLYVRIIFYTFNVAEKRCNNCITQTAPVTSKLDTHDIFFLMHNKVMFQCLPLVIFVYFKFVEKTFSFPWYT